MNCPACHQPVDPAPIAGHPMSPEHALDYHLASCEAARCPKCQLNLVNCERMILDGDPQDVAMAMSLLRIHGGTCGDKDVIVLLINSGHARKHYEAQREGHVVMGAQN